MHYAASDSKTERLAESGTVTAEKIPNNLPRLERAMKQNLPSVIKQLPFFQHFFNAILYLHDCKATGARLYTRKDKSCSRPFLHRVRESGPSGRREVDRRGSTQLENR